MRLRGAGHSIQKRGPEARSIARPTRTGRRMGCLCDLGAPWTLQPTAHRVAIAQQERQRRLVKSYGVAQTVYSLKLISWFSSRQARWPMVRGAVWIFARPRKPMRNSPLVLSSGALA